MTTTVTIKLEHLHEGKVAEVFVGDPKTGRCTTHRPYATLTEVGQVYSGVVHDGATLIVKEVDAPPPVEGA